MRAIISPDFRIAGAGGAVAAAYGKRRSAIGELTPANHVPMCVCATRLRVTVLCTSNEHGPASSLSQANIVPHKRRETRIFGGVVVTDASG